jgi:ABC-type polysaccharide/polyol phosphate transport system ATPase subunit
MDMVRVENVSIKFRLMTDHITGIKETIIAKAKGKLKYHEFWALNDVSFSVEKGEVLGIVGHNGAGKSTVLKIIAGIMKPNSGKVYLGGNVVPMLELGSGFDYDLTGRENIFLNGAILGYSKEFLYEKYDEILAFSELGEFIDNPIRNYSSGMLMRLAFSIATIVQPEILICDEVLAVGDERFQAKSYKKMMELMNGGATVLFVSHNIDQIKNMCKHVVWLDHGQVKMTGDAETVCNAYREWLYRPEEG